MTTRRTFLSSAAALVGVGVTGLPKAEGAVVVFPRSFPICLRDARFALSFSSMVNMAVARLSARLPKKGKFRLVWMNIPDPSNNPLGDTGFFLAVPAHPDQTERITWDQEGLLQNLLHGKNPA